MSISFSLQKLRGEQRRNILEEVQTRMQAEALEAVGRVATEILEREVTVKLGRAKRIPRQVDEQAREIEWQGTNCGCRDATYFTREGHYRRDLQTGWGQVQNLRGPMLACQKCQPDGICDYAILEKNKRFWLDLDQEVLWSRGSCQRLREIAERWSATLGSRVGRRTINERMNQMEPLAQK